VNRAGERLRMWMWMGLGSNILFNLKHYRKFSGNYALVQMPHIHICIVRSVTTHVPWAHYMPVHSPHFLTILPT